MREEGMWDERKGLKSMKEQIISDKTASPAFPRLTLMGLLVEFSYWRAVGKRRFH